MNKKTDTHKTANPPGPVPKDINWDLFEQLCSIQCTQSEIASMLKIDEDTLRVRTLNNYKEDYSVIYKKYSESGKCSLRRYQFIQSKEKPNMAIWLGKQWLGQKDNEERKDTPPNDAALANQHELIKTKYENILKDEKIKELEAKLNESQPKADQVNQPSDQAI